MIATMSTDALLELVAWANDRIGYRHRCRPVPPSTEASWRVLDAEDDAAMEAALEELRRRGLAVFFPAGIPPTIVVEVIA